jgi:hypothetical protein
MMQEQKKTVGLNTGTAGQGRPKKGGVSETPPKKDDRLTLAEAGIERRAATKNNENIVCVIDFLSRISYSSALTQIG